MKISRNDETAKRRNGRGSGGGIEPDEPIGNPLLDRFIDHVMAMWYPNYRGNKVITEDMLDYDHRPLLHLLNNRKDKIHWFSLYIRKTGETTSKKYDCFLVELSDTSDPIRIPRYPLEFGGYGASILSYEEYPRYAIFVNKGFDPTEDKREYLPYNMFQAVLAKNEEMKLKTALSAEIPSEARTILFGNQTGGKLSRLSKSKLESLVLSKYNTKAKLIQLLH